MISKHLNHSATQLKFILTQKFFALDFLEPEQLSYFKCLNWSGSYLKQSLQEGNGTLSRESFTFIPVYTNGLGPASIGPEDQLLISFRALAPDQVQITASPKIGYAIIRRKFQA